MSPSTINIMLPNDYLLNYDSGLSAIGYEKMIRN